MLHFCRWLVALSAATGGTLAAGSAGAASSEVCDTPKLNVLVPDDPKWDSATSRLAEHLRSLPDLDRCARVTVRPDATGVTLKLTTSDGREAQRHVDSVEELLTAAEALLVLPPAPAAHASQASPLELPPKEQKPSKPEATSAHVELGVGGSFRLGGGPVYAGGGLMAFAGFALDGWLLTMTARVDVTDRFVNQPTPADFIMGSTAVGVSAGRRLEVGQASLDGLLGANVVLEGQDADDGEREIRGASEDFRLSTAVRISGPRSATIRAFAVADFEGSPRRIRSDKYINHSLPTLPWWSGGLAVGILWGAR